MYSFFAMMARMKNIERWALMRNSIRENISEHSLEVAMLAHGLAIIANEKCGQELDPNEVALMGIYHDANEIITGDMPTPVKYFDDDIMEAYKRVEDVASRTMVDKLPDYMRKYYEPVFFQKEGKEYEWRIVKAADKLSALIKCKQELGSGNQEFKTAYETTKEALHKMQMKEVEIFIEEFLPAYDQTLDELQAR
ncbi:MAG: 5'-deoxynucleotidase [Eubacterium sp.]|nr:5'-deoxynucleotidase [Eubacterium sp.]